MSMTCDRREAVYLGPDWLVYVADAFAFKSSEFVAPGFLVAPAGRPLALRLTRTGQGVNGNALLHAAGLWSALDEQPGGVLYVDPLTPHGIALQRRAGRTATSLDALDAICPGADDFERLVAGGTDPRAMHGWVASVLQHALAGAEVPTLDERVLSLRGWLHDHNDGRVPVAALASRVGMSADHLRQTFSRQVGITLSGYQAWVRLYGVARMACEDHARARRPEAASTMLDAGFYDASHGSRVIRRYFDLTPSELLAPGRFVDCRDAAAGPGPA